MLNMVQTALFIIELDGQLHPRATTWLAVKALIDSLGDHNMFLIEAALGQFFPAPKEFEKLVSERAKEIARLQGTPS